MPRSGKEQIPLRFDQTPVDPEVLASSKKLTDAEEIERSRVLQEQIQRSKTVYNEEQNDKNPGRR